MKNWRQIRLSLLATYLYEIWSIFSHPSNKNSGFCFLPLAICLGMPNSLKHLCPSLVAPTKSHGLKTPFVFMFLFQTTLVNILRNVIVCLNTGKCFCECYAYKMLLFFSGSLFLKEREGEPVRDKRKLGAKIDEKRYMERTAKLQRRHEGTSYSFLFLWKEEEREEKSTATPSSSSSSKHSLYVLLASIHLHISCSMYRVYQ